MLDFDTQALQNKQGRSLYIHNDDPDVPRESTLSECERQAFLAAYEIVLARSRSQKK